MQPRSTIEHTVLCGNYSALSAVFYFLCTSCGSHSYMCTVPFALQMWHDSLSAIRLLQRPQVDETAEVREPEKVRQGIL